MKKDKNILVPTDFTTVAETGLVTAIDLAKQIGAKVNILHIIKEYGSNGFQTMGDTEGSTKEDSERNHFMIKLIQKRNEQMHELVEKHKLKGVHLSTTLEFGPFEDQLENHLKANPMDLIVMGTSGETSISEFLSGNHAAKAIRVADVPVLAVKDYYPILSKDRLLILVDLKDYDLQKVKLIKQFSDLLELKVIIGHVKQLKDIAMGDIYYKLQKFALENNFLESKVHIIGKGEKINAVKEFVEAFDVNMIASISEGESGLSRLIFGSDTEDFINEIDRPLLAISQ